MVLSNVETRAPGRRTGVLLIHGLCGSPAELRFVANGLARDGYDVVCPELAGHGASAEALEATSWRDWLDGVERAYEALAARCDTIVAGGLSTGAVLALMLAAEHRSKIKALLLFAPTLWLDGWSIPWHARLFGLLRHKSLARLVRFPPAQNNGIKDDRIRQFVRGALDSAKKAGKAPAYTPGGAVIERRWLVEAALKRLPEVTQPALILHPRDDDFASLRNAWHLQQALPGSVEVCVLEDSYHYVTVDRQRHVVLERSRSFLARVAPAGRTVAAPSVIAA
jgi:carboxylesterase